MTLPRVTDILKSVGLIDTSFMTEYGRDRGTAVHMACHYDDLGDLDVASIDPIILPYLEAWRMFRREHKCVWAHIEERREHPVFGYCGTPDRDGTVDGLWSIVDIKGGAKQPWHKVQLALYQAMMDVHTRYQRLVVRLQPDGQYQLDIFGPETYAADLTVGLSALSIHNFKLNGGK